MERARLYKAVNETCFGVQIATKVIDEGVAAAKLAQEAGAAWVDLNCGCPIPEATAKGMGAALLAKPTKLAKLVNGIVRRAEIPVTVKIRTGVSDKKINCERVVHLLKQAGAAAVTIHGRTKEQRYKKPADWDLVRAVGRNTELPIIGNGDILTFYDVQRLQQQEGCVAWMVGRGALIKPWLFQEHKEGRELLLSAKDRIGVYRHLASHMKAHFGNDAWGKKKAWYFFPWHFSFFHRYRHLPENIYGEEAASYPLILTRMSKYDIKIGEDLDSLPLLERLLRCESEASHESIAHIIWDAGSDLDAENELTKVADENLLVWEEEVQGGGRAGSDENSSSERG